MSSTNRRSFHLQLLLGQFAVVRLPAGSVTPDWATSTELLAITHTSDELSIVCDEAQVPDHMQAVRGFRALRVAGPLSFDDVGVLASLSRPLAAAGVSIFVLSTFDTDYLLLQSGQLQTALNALAQAGHSVADSSARDHS